MFSQKLLLPALAVLGSVAAQSSCGSATATMTINSGADFSAAANCQTFKGSVLVSNVATGIVNLDGPEQITGSIIVHDAHGLIELTSNSIASISGTMDLNNLTVLSTVQFTKLTSVGGLLWEGLPNLFSPTFPDFVRKADSVIISNTHVNSLVGLNLTTVGVLDINNNIYLNEFTTPLANVTQSLSFSANSQQLEVDLPNLIWANNATFRNVSKLSVPSLQTVNGSLVFDENFFETFNTPNLTTIGDFKSKVGSLSFIGNSVLTNITFKSLTVIGGGVQIANNTHLMSISMPALSQVGGAIDLSGNFTTPDLSGLTDVAGAVNVQSTANIDCTAINNFKSKNVIQGNNFCAGKIDDPTTLGGSPTSSSSASPSSSKGAAAGSYTLNSRAAIGMSVVGGLFGLLV